MAQAHTPGPWCAGWGNSGLTGPTTPSAHGPTTAGTEWTFSVVSCGTETIAIVPDQEGVALRPRRGTGDANARLIAAAPDMLSLLERWAAVAGPSVLAEETRAAIAKAKGGAE